MFKAFLDEVSKCLRSKPVERNEATLNGMLVNQIYLHESYTRNVLSSLF